MFCMSSFSSVSLFFAELCLQMPEKGLEFVKHFGDDGVFLIINHLRVTAFLATKISDERALVDAARTQSRWITSGRVEPLYGISS